MDQINLEGAELENAKRNPEQEELKRQQLLEARRVGLRSILTVEAQERLNRISSVKPEKATLIENFLLQNAQKYAYGTSKVTDQELKQIIEAITKSQSNTGTIRIQRKRWDSDDEI
ncbi:Double-stranded DNA-binding domain protein [Theileria parva strain Muguga]|uniref:Uncharacterized protein n=1 Tax=Theileria parva TaxID=5875 RepID=Q4N0R0_THEPA|nr:Double-stranded DNA-binding domain protein [Theileria parva strain Muguga]EAN30789.1 Double-stranded DNA-binding domain protein [Theileria parva strain Muguga]|eukprot:XP_763072.1 hypothetical protein [Theileria parva strain Muguga]